MTSKGCVDTVIRPLDIVPNFTFYIPSAFTPNDDRNNNMFYGKGMGLKEYDLWIFDLWGLEIYHGHYVDSNVPYDYFGEDGMPAQCKWDGTLNGHPVQQDVYVWKVRLTDVYDKKTLVSRT
ncbi:MAG: hypothetical protein RIQ47_2 [Bacteroidota bacterium]|jgi:hypothetical protein